MPKISEMKRFLFVCMLIWHSCFLLKRKLILDGLQVKVLRSMRPLRVDDVVIGQYKSHTKGGVSYPGYTDDKTVPKDSLTPTFAAAALFIDNARWDGVPFLMKAGKALHNRRFGKIQTYDIYSVVWLPFLEKLIPLLLILIYHTKNVTFFLGLK